MKTLTTILIIIGLVTPAAAFETTLAWEPNTEADMSHYAVYQADVLNGKTGPWDHVTDVAHPVTTVKVTWDAPGNKSWYVTAIDTDGNESGPSNTVWLYDRIPPANPINLRKETTNGTL
jgi:hypothetical protein